MNKQILTKWRFYIFCTALIAAIAAGVSKMSKHNTKNGIKPSCIRVGITKIYESYDPTQLITTDHVFAIQNLTGKLIEVGEDNSLYSAIAESWQVSEDKRTYTLKLSPNAKFSDGSPITITDVIFSLKRQIIFSGTHVDLKAKILGGAKLKSLDDDIPGIQALTEQILQIKIVNSDDRFLYTIAFPEWVILPKREAVKAVGHLSFEVTSGPYYLKPATGYLHLEKNPHYYYKHGSAAQCIHLYGYPNPEEVIQALSNKKLDLIDYGAAFSPNFSKFINNPDFDLIFNESKSLAYFVFNTRSKTVEKLGNRQWIRSKLKSREFIPYGAGSIFLETNQFLVDTQQGYLSPDDVNIATQDNSPTVPDSTKIRVLYPAVFGEAYQHLLQEKLSTQLGKTVEMITYPEGNVVEALEANNWDLFFYLVGMGEKATSVLFSYHFRGINPLYPWKDPEIDNAMNTMLSTNSESERLEQYKTVSKRLLNQAYILPIAQFRWPVIARSDLHFEKINQFQWGHPLWTLSWKN
jgi:ABC-type oligopeptide transport system substrate-binding subunit